MRFLHRLFCIVDLGEFGASFNEMGETSEKKMGEILEYSLEPRLAQKNYFTCIKGPRAPW